MVTFDARATGTPAIAWETSGIRDCPDVDLGAFTEVVVVAAHPDDETLGAGGLIAAAANSGIPVRVVVVTDGGAGGDAATRSAELHAAIAELGTAIPIVELGFPDGGVRERDDVAAALAGVLSDSPGALLVAPWSGDGHRDHRVVGEAVLEVAQGRTVLGYPIWAWHWDDPSRPTLPRGSLRGIRIDAARKRRAIARHRSQVSGPDPLLRPHLLEHFTHDREVFVA